MSFLKKLFGGREPQPVEAAAVPGSKPAPPETPTPKEQKALVLAEMGLAWAKLVRAGKELAAVQDPSEGRNVLRAVAGQMEDGDAKMAALFRKAADITSDAEIVPLCHRSATQLTQQAVLIGKAFEGFSKDH